MYETTNYQPELTEEETNIALEDLKHGLDKFDQKTLFRLHRNDIDKTVNQQLEKYPCLKEVSIALLK